MFRWWRRRRLGSVRITAHMLETARKPLKPVTLVGGDHFVAYGKSGEPFMTVYVKSRPPVCDVTQIDVDIVLHGLVLPLRDTVPEMMEKHAEITQQVKEAHNA